MKHSNFIILDPILSSDYVILLRTSAGASGNSRALVSDFLSDLVALISTDDIAWTALNKSESDLADLATKSHTDLSDIGTLTHTALEAALVAADPSKIVNLAPYPSDVDIEIRDGTIGLAVPATMNGLNLTAALASVYVPGADGGTTNIQIRRSRAGVEEDMLSTQITLSNGEYFIADGVIDTSYDDVNTGDLIFIDVDQVNTTPPKGLSVVLTFS